MLDFDTDNAGGIRVPSGAASVTTQSGAFGTLTDTGTGDASVALSPAMDASEWAPLLTILTTSRAGQVVITSDTAWQVTTFDLATPTAADSAFVLTAQRYKHASS